MTEGQWLAATEPQAMLVFLRNTGRLTERKARLFACACLRREAWQLLSDDLVRRAVERAEQYAQGLISRAALRNAAADLEDVTYNTDRINWLANSAARWTVSADAGAGDLAENAADFAASAVGMWKQGGADLTLVPTQQLARASRAVLVRSLQLEQTAQAALLRCIFGNPSRPLPSVGVAVLAWNDRTVVRIAEALYQEQQWDNVGILADALDEAGCEDADAIEHLRGTGPHCRGCRVVDAILGKA